MILNELIFSILFLDTSNQSPQLKPYPSWSAHQIGDETPEIVSPYRIRADNCGNLWVLDTGFDGNGTILASPRILVYDLHNDNLKRSYTFPPEQVKDDSIFASIAVEDEDCENLYAYCADMGKPGLVIYSWKLDNSWRMTHNFFNPDPTSGNFSIKGTTFQWNYGLVGIALSKPQSDGHPLLYFHPYVSTDEFMVSTKFLKNETLATSNGIYHNFEKIGTRGPNSQSNAQFLDKKTGVLFYTIPNLNAISCWYSTSKYYTIKTQGRILMNDTLMEFPNDIKVDDQSRLWVISNRYQKFVNSDLDPREINFRIMTATVQDAVDHTSCDPKTKPFPKIIDGLSGLLNNNQPNQPNITKAAMNSNARLQASFIVLISILIAKFLA
jgi:hypothetical protein